MSRLARTLHGSHLLRQESVEPYYPDPTPFLTAPPFSTYSFPDRLPSLPSLHHPVTLLPGTFTPTLPLPGMFSWFIQVSTQMSPPQSGVL